MEPISFQGDAFSEYFCTKLLWNDPQLGSLLDAAGAESSYKTASSTIRFAQRQLRDREQARSTYSLLLRPMAELLGWKLGDLNQVATDEGEEDGGVPLQADNLPGSLARVLCIAPDAHLEAAPTGLHRRFAPTLSLARVLKEEALDYGLLLNAFELRLICSIGTLPSHIGFDLTAIAEGTASGLEVWKLLHALLRQDSFAGRPRLLDRVREIGREHQQRVSTDLGSQVQQAVVRFMQGLLDHPENRSVLPSPMTDAFLHDLYQQTLRLLYRLLFILYAEDLNLLPMDVLTYREGYSFHRLIQLAAGKRSESLELVDPNGSFFQDSLTALFNLLRRGVRLGPEGEIKPYGGGLFDTEQTQLLDGLHWGNATVDNVIECLTQVPAPRGYVGKVRLVRQINQRQPDVATAWEKYKRETNLYKHKLIGDGLYRWQRDKVLNEKTGGQKTTGGDPDLFKLFTERFLSLSAPGGGRIGILIPAAFYSSEGSKGLRRMVFENARFEHLYSYENRYGIFPAVHKQFKFCVFVVSKNPADPTVEFPASFMLHNPAWLDAAPTQQASRIVKLSPEFIRQQSPTHLSFFEFRSEKEKALVQRIYAQFPPLGKHVEGTWNVSFTTELHMTQDSWLFRDRERLREFGGQQHRGEYWTLPERAWFDARPEQYVRVSRTENQLRGKKPRPESTRSKNSAARERTYEGVVLLEEQHEDTCPIMVPGGKYVPLYEGRMVHQFDHAAKAYVSGSGRSQVWRDLDWNEKELIPHYFVEETHAAENVQSSGFVRAGFCDVTGQTNERSVLACVLPANVPAGNSVPTLVTEPYALEAILCWIALANSLTVDWLLRLKISNHLNFFYWLQTPLPRLSGHEVEAQRLLTAAASLSHGLPRDLIIAENAPGCLRFDERCETRAVIDATAATLLSLQSHELAGVLSSFPLLDRDQPWLPGDGFIAYDKKGRPKLKPRSFITRDKVLLEYFRLKGERPPEDVVEFFAAAGVDIDGGKMLAGEPPADAFNAPIYATGPIRSLEQRVRIAEQELGAVAYVPTVRKKPTPEALEKIEALAQKLAHSVAPSEESAA